MESKAENKTNIKTKSLEHIEHMPRGTYLVDMDGVLFDYAGRFAEIWNRTHPELPEFRPEMQKHFYIEEDFPEKYHNAIRQITEGNADFFKEFKPIEGALEGLLKLAENNPVYICTAPSINSRNCMANKVESIRTYLGDDWVRRTIITKDKTLVQATYLIDDKPGITGAFEKPWVHILYDQPYNRDIETDYRFSWSKGLFRQE